MGRRLDYYAYLSEHTIRRLYTQTQRRWLIPRLGIEIGLELPFVKLKATTSDGRPDALADQVKAVVAHLERHEPEHIGTVDDPKRYIKGTLPMFSYFLPQGFVFDDLSRPELSTSAAQPIKRFLGWREPPATYLPPPMGR